jgi:ATP:ADP antiporter, AAA family
MSITNNYFLTTFQEIKKLGSMSIVLFLLLFNHCVLWNIKDALLVTTAGAEVIPFIKVWAILPCAVGLTIVFTWLSNCFKQETVFYLMTGSFLLFFAAFAFVIYPSRDLLHPVISADFLETLLPKGAKGLISMYRHWTFTTFYVACELWNTMIVTVLFWSFANRITLLSEAPGFYSVLSLVSNAAIVAAGVISLSLLGDGVFKPYIPFGHNAWEQTMMMLMLLIVFNGLMAMGMYRWMSQHIFMDPDDLPINKLAKKNKFSLWDSLIYLSNSKYLIYITVIVLGYNLVINLVEVVWKDQLKNLYPEIHEYNSYISSLQVIQGILALLTSLVMAKMIKFLGWTKTALVTPVIMLGTGLLFFGMMFFQDTFRNYSLAIVGMSPLALAILFGSAQNCLSKACKTSLFDSTKEMAYIPLSPESKLKGKAAIDGVGARFAKSGGSIIHQGFLLMLGTVSASTPYVGLLLVIVIFLWIAATRNLGRHIPSAET